MSSEPSKKRTRDSSTETEPESPPAFATSTVTIEVSLLQSINSKLSILEHLHADVKDLKASLEFSQSQIDTLALENRELKGTVTNLSNQVNHLTSENRIMKEKLLDLQCRSMRNNLFFSGIHLSTSTPDDPEKAVKEFMQSSLKFHQRLLTGLLFTEYTVLLPKTIKSHLR